MKVPNEKKQKRPDLSKQTKGKESLECNDDYEFELNVTTKLQEDEDYIGQITECEVGSNKKGEPVARIVIDLENDGGKYKSSNNLNFDPSPFNDLTNQVGNILGRRAKVKDILGIWVQFSVKYNKNYCNLKTIEWIEEPVSEYEDDE